MAGVFYRRLSEAARSINQRMSLLVLLCCCVGVSSFVSVSPRLPSATSISSSTGLSATWSDSKAVQDYQNFLASGRQDIERKKDGAAVIVKPIQGDTELAEALAMMGMGDDVVVTPDQPIPATLDGQNEFPIYITLPPWQIGDFISNLSQNPTYYDKIEDFVFFSGGMKYGNVEDVLKDRGYCRDSMTQVLISGMRITRLKRVQDIAVNLGLGANGEKKIAGACTACGKWNGAIAQRLERSNIRCEMDFYREWRRKMWERSVFDAVFRLLGVVRSEPTTIAEVGMYFGEEVSDIVWEMSQLLRGWKAVTLLYGFEERLFGMSESIEGDEKCLLGDEDVYPHIWGNFVYLQRKAYVDYLQVAKYDNGLLKGIELPVRADSSYTTNMRQGNLRADGVI